jgi:hypothetical protein
VSPEFECRVGQALFGIAASEVEASRTRRSRARTALSSTDTRKYDRALG